MKKYTLPVILMSLLFFTMESCRVVGGIFKAGAVFGIILVVLVVVLIMWIIRKAS